VIDGNVIRRCLGRELEVDPKMLGQGGFGGIALGHVEYLAIRDNCIEDNGPNQLEPVCGIFILYGEGIEISRNWILNNGAKGGGAGDDNPQLHAKLGARGGINIVKCTAPAEMINLTPISNALTGTSGFIGQNALRLFAQTGMPAAKVHDNVVSVPLGQALKMSALGAVSVIGNQFTSRGMVLNTDSPSFWASTVMIINLGRSRDLLIELVSYQGVRTNNSYQLANGPAYGSAVETRFGYLKSGNVLFSNNQCSLDLQEAGLSLALSSILIFSLDDVAFNNNQCDCNLLDDFVITHALLFGITVRANDNRFREGLFNAVLSAITVGLLNITTDNESTHCLVVEGFRKLRRHNLVLLSALFERDPCRGFEGDDDDDCGFSKTPGGTYWVDPARKTETVNTTTLNTK
jgi:hypothetical protein